MTRPIDETVLTAYALGECSPEETAQVQALLRRSPSTRAVVEQLQELAAIAEEALLEGPALLDDQRQTILDAADACDRVQVPVLAPVVAPVPLPPPPSANENEDEVVPLRPKRRRTLLWTARITAIAAGLLLAVSIPAFLLVESSPTLPFIYMNKNMKRSSTADAPVASVMGSPDRTSPEQERQVLLGELERKMSESGAELSLASEFPERASAMYAIGPNKRQELVEQGRLPATAGELAGQRMTTADRERRLQASRSMRRMESRQKSEASFHGGDGFDANKPDSNGERYNPISHNAYQLATDAPLSTFSIDVDTASYANVRRFLDHHTLPPASAVRIEELINYFDYGYAPPIGDVPFATHVEIAGCPWNPDHRLARIGIKGQVIDEGELPPSNLVFLLDVSGSMSAQNKLPLVQQAIRLLVNELDERDRVAIVVYAGSSGLVLPSTSGENPQAILNALNKLKSGGSTAGGAGIQLAYQTAVANFIDGGSNRVILATDGDFNVGATDQGTLVELIEDRAKSGVFLTVLGFGMGNLQDGTLEQLADHGNGNYAYIDDLDEARKVLVTERGGTLVTIAKDVKIQVEFNPLQVHAYRLIGYENRTMAAQDFADDSKDAGEIGAGHTVTALYEVVPAGTDLAVPSAPILKYQQPTSTTQAAATGELMTVKLRYKQPDGTRSRLLSFPVTDGGTAWASASRDFRHAAAVAAYGMLLRDSPHKGQASWSMVQQLAAQGVGRDPHGYRAEFGELVRQAQQMSGE